MMVVWSDEVNAGGSILEEGIDEGSISASSKNITSYSQRNKNMI